MALQGRGNMHFGVTPCRPPVPLNMSSYGSRKFAPCCFCVGKTKLFGAENTIFLLRAQPVVQITFSRRQRGNSVCPSCCLFQPLSRTQPRAFSPLLTAITTPFEYVSQFALGQSLWKFPSCIWFMLFQPFFLSCSHVAMNSGHQVVQHIVDICTFFFP